MNFGDFQYTGDFQFINNDGDNPLVSRYENMIISGKSQYFDISEFEDIINYYLFRDNGHKAVNVVNYAIKLHPYSTELKFKLAFVYYKSKKYLFALKVLNKLQQIEPSNHEVFILKGKIFISLNQTKQALQNFQHAISLQSDDDSVNDLYFEIGEYLEQEENYQLALNFFNKCYEMDNDDDEVIYEIASCYDMSEQYDKSIIFYQKLLDIDPFDDEIWFNLGVIYNKIDDVDKALEAYDFALAIDQKSLFASFNKANTLANNKKYSQAIPYYIEFIKEIDDNPQAFCYLAECYRNINKLDNALEYYDKALNFDDNYSDAFYGKSLVFYETENYTQALISISKAIKIDNISDYLFLSAKINTKLNKFENAEKAYIQALEIASDDKEIWISYAKFFYNQNKISKAIEILKKADKIISNQAEINFSIAALLMKNNNDDQAFDFFEKGLEIDFDKSNVFFNFYPQAKSNEKINFLINKYK